MTDRVSEPSAGKRRLPISSEVSAAIGLVLVTAIWGSTFPLIKGVVEDVPVADFLTVRFVIAALVLAAISPRAVSRLSPEQRRNGLVLGLLYGAGQLLQTVGLQYTAASVSGFITGMYVVFTPLLTAFLLRSRVGTTAWVAVAISTAGLAVLSLKGFSLGFGEILTLLSAAVYAAHIVALGRWSQTRDAYGLTVLQMAGTAIVCAPFSLSGGITLPDTGGGVAALIYTALVAGALAIIIQTWAQAHLAATRAAVIMTMEPVFAAFFSVLAGGESVTARMLVGGSLVLAAMYLAELGPRRGRDAEVVHGGPV